MKTKVMIVVVTMLFALAMMAQTAIQAAPAAPAAGDKAGTCACCSGDKCPMGKDAKMAEGKSCRGEGCCITRRSNEPTRRNGPCYSTTARCPAGPR